MARGGRASYGGLILVINSSVAPGVVPLVYGLGSEWFPPHLSPYKPRIYGGTPVRWVVRHKPRTVYCAQGEGPIRWEAVSLIPGKGHDSRRVGVNCFLLFVIVLFF